MTELNRRTLIGTGLSLPLLGLPGCTTLEPRFDFDAAARRLIAASSQRAFTRLVPEGGFYHHDIARVLVPAELGGSGAAGLLSPLLASPEVQANLLRIVNVAASDATRAAVPVVYDAIRTIKIGDPVAVIRGGPTAATDYLHRALGNRVYDAIHPQIGLALRRRDDGTLARALQAAEGYGWERLQRDIAFYSQEGIYRAIAFEEAAMRRDPALTGDRYLMRIFKPLR